jgi:hypothetical protein
MNKTQPLVQKEATPKGLVELVIDDAKLSIEPREKIVYNEDNNLRESPWTNQPSPKP